MLLCECGQETVDVAASTSVCYWGVSGRNAICLQGGMTVFLTHFALVPVISLN